MGISLPLASVVEPAEAGETEGCIQCQQGSKLVLFVTGHCHWQCDYCPLSENRREVDVMFANERPCHDLDEVIEEARAMRATGTGITGGDPLMARERSLEAISRLKAEFGPEHHIHMYTSIPFPPRHAAEFAAVGLDEIRFHLLDLELGRYLETMQACSDAGLLTGVELPAEPDKQVELAAVVEALRDAAVEFLNLNELEITVGNQDGMELRGFNISDELTAGAEGSAELASLLKRRVDAANAGLPDPESGEVRTPYGYHLKFCTSSYKDAGQLRARFARRAQATLRAWEQISDDDTILFGALYTSQSDSIAHMDELRVLLGLAPGWMEWNPTAERIELPLAIAEEFCEEFALPCALIEVHPTHERLEVGLVWLNEQRP